MERGRRLVRFGGTVVLLGLLAVGGARSLAQEATPEEGAGGARVPRPAHIHAGNCDQLGEIVAPLTDLTAPRGDRVGQADRAELAQSSFTSVPLTLDQILAADHAINVHLSADEIGTYIACGEIGGVVDANGALAIGLREQSGSGFTGIAYLAPGADGVSTGVSAFVTRERAARARERQAATPAVGGAAAATETPAAPETGATPSAAAEAVDVSLTEFAIDMPVDVPAGTVTFNVTNDGTIEHSFEIEGQGIEEALAANLAPGESGSLTLDLAPGTYVVYCPVGGHRGLGMELEVTAG